MKYRRKSIVFEAIQFVMSGDTNYNTYEFTQKLNMPDKVLIDGNGEVYIATYSGIEKLNSGDYVSISKDYMVYVYRQAEFEDAFEPVND